MICRLVHQHQISGTESRYNSRVVYVGLKMNFNINKRITQVDKVFEQRIAKFFAAQAFFRVIQELRLANNTGGLALY